MVEFHHPVQTSAVYLCGAPAQCPSIPPPSPPSPLSPRAAEPEDPVEGLCLEDDASSASDSTTPVRLSGAVHVLDTEATALQSLARLYESDPVARRGFDRAVQAITTSSSERGKLVIIGVGKSGHIAKKLVATFNSLGVPATFLHPTEALHGDLGKIGRHDTILFITFSGKTHELLSLLPHIDAHLPTIVLTSHTQPRDCELIRQHAAMILLPAPIHEPETVSFGVSAPTTSTTVALSVGDALAIVAARELHPSVSTVFAQNHPGGAIGEAFGKPQSVLDLASPLHEIPALSQSGADVLGADVLKAAYDSKTGWVRIGDLLVSPGRIRQLSTAHMAQPVREIPWLAVGQKDWIAISARARVSQAVEWIGDMRNSAREEDAVVDDHSILAVADEGDVVGVLEAGLLSNWRE